MLKLLTALVIAVACLACGAAATNWRPCPGGANTLKFTVQGCEGKRVCPVRRGQSYWVEMQFRAGSSSDSMTASVIGKSRGMSSWLPLSGGSFDSNACDYLDTRCPVARNAVHTYRYPLYIEQYFPTTNYVIAYGLKDAKGKTQGCARLVIKVY